MRSLLDVFASSGVVPRDRIFTRRVIWVCIALFVFSQLLFLINIQFPRTHNFDEFHYVPSAKQFLEMRENQNWEHPPLGKLIMAAGIGLWGDIPIGWRYMSALFGTATLIGMYVWALVLFGSEATALWVALITVFNQLLYVQARIGMLDTFMFGFVVWALVAFTRTWRVDADARVSRRYLYAAGTLLGLATASKWFSVVPWATCIGLVLVVRVLQGWKTLFADEVASDWYQPGLWRGVRWRDFVLALGVTPLLVYFATFIPFYIIQKPSVGFWDLFLMQKKMYEGQLRVLSQHPYMSSWQDWPLLKRPIWYAFDKEGPNGEWVRGVILIGNPIVMFGGVAAIFVCLWNWIRTRSRDSFLILVFYAAFFGSWVMIPRKVAFYYYYYPAGMILSLALAKVFEPGTMAAAGKMSRALWVRWIFLAACFAMFVYFFPVLAALRIPAEDFRKWMWFRSWV